MTMEFYAVIDTNVLVSALLNADSTPGKIVARALVGNIVPVVHEQIIAEYVDVLHRQRFHFVPRQVDGFIADFIKRAEYALPIHADETMRDEKDRIFYEVTLAMHKTHNIRLVTGNTKHFPKKTFVVTPAQMLELVEDSEQ